MYYFFNIIFAQTKENKPSVNRSLKGAEQEEGREPLQHHNRKEPTRLREPSSVQAGKQKEPEPAVLPRSTAYKQKDDEHIPVVQTRSTRSTTKLMDAELKQTVPTSRAKAKKPKTDSASDCNTQ